jgi:hypothetical protein
VRIKTTVQESQQNKIEKNNDRSGRIVKKKPTTNLGDFIKKRLFKLNFYYLSSYFLS